VRSLWGGLQEAKKKHLLEGGGGKTWRGGLNEKETSGLLGVKFLFITIFTQKEGLRVLG
jgi:hypothetical protein